MPHRRNLQEHGGLIRFEVPTAAGPVTAFVSRATCQARDPSASRQASLADFVRRHQTVLERIVQDKLRAGARPPVVVSARDLVDARPSAAATPA